MENKMLRCAVAVILSLVCVSVPAPALAEADAKVFLREIDKGDELMLRLLDGYANGFLWANVFLAQDKAKPFFCAPGKLSITAQQNADILRKYIAGHPGDGDLPAGFALMLAYKATFPC